MILWCGNSVDAPRRQKAAVCVMERLCVLAELHSGRSYSAVGHEFCVNESTIYEMEMSKQRYIKQEYVLIG